MPPTALDRATTTPSEVVISPRWYWYWAAKAREFPGLSLRLFASNACR